MWQESGGKGGNLSREDDSEENCTFTWRCTCATLSQSWQAISSYALHQVQDLF